MKRLGAKPTVYGRTRNGSDIWADDIEQEASIAEWQGRDPWAARIDALRSLTKWQRRKQQTAHDSVDPTGDTVLDRPTEAYEPYLDDMLACLEEPYRTTARMLAEGARQVDIARHFGVTESAVAVRCRVIRAKLTAAGFSPMVTIR